MARGIGVLVLIAILAALIAAGVLLLTEAGRGTDVGEFLRDSAPEQIQELRDLIQQRSE